MSILKRESWSEEDVLALPTGEHDFFDRKSGGDFTANRVNFIEFVAKALSAFANSGGGHLILGLNDDAVTFDGLPQREGRTSVREWLEQKIPNLVAYELQDFRVHEVIPSTPSTIPAGRVAIVIDVGDSALAPHQTATANSPKNYYYRQGGHSVIAPHHYLELLRQRLVGPDVAVTLTNVVAEPPYETADGELILPISITFELRNQGRVAAYKWSLYPFEVTFDNAKAGADFTFDSRVPLPKDQRGRPGGVELDLTILPGTPRTQRIRMGVRLRPDDPTYKPAIFEESELALKTTVHFRLATETSPGEPFSVRLRDYLDPDAVAGAFCKTFGIS